MLSLAAEGVGWRACNSDLRGAAGMISGEVGVALCLMAFLMTEWVWSCDGGNKTVHTLVKLLI